MSIITLTYEEYFQLDKDSVEDMINSLLKDFFKQFPFLKFKKMDFGNYWTEIEKDIERYRTWNNIPNNNFSSGTNIHVLFDMKKFNNVSNDPKMTQWQSMLYDELHDFFNFFKLTIVVPNVELDII
jgi:hypothetical protein